MLRLRRGLLSAGRDREPDQRASSWPRDRSHQLLSLLRQSTPSAPDRRCLRALPRNPSGRSKNLAGASTSLHLAGTSTQSRSHRRLLGSTHPVPTPRLVPIPSGVVARGDPAGRDLIEQRLRFPDHLVQCSAASRRSSRTRKLVRDQIASPPDPRTASSTRTSWS